MALQWWWIPAGLAVVASLLLLKPARGPLWPFLLILPVLGITATFAFAAWRNDGLTTFLQQDAVFQTLLATRFACAILMVVVASGRRIFALALAGAALLADPLLFNYFACTFGTELCR